MASPRTVATVDIGTNTLLLLILRRRQDGSHEVLVDEVRFGRLGKNLDASGNLDPGAIERSLEAVREYHALLAEHPVDAIRVVGTQALREAANAAEFVAPAEELLGVQIETIAGEREAELVYGGVSQQVPDAGDCIIADVGGGSTEVIVAQGGQVQRWTSLKVGSVRITERHLRGNPPSAEETRAASADIDAVLATAELPSGLPVLGTAGTATTMAAMDLRLHHYDRGAVHGHVMDAARVDKQLASLLELSVAERRSLPGLEPERADVIAGGALIFSRLLTVTNAPRFTIADSGVRWGLAYELLAT